MSEKKEERRQYRLTAKETAVVLESLAILQGIERTLMNGCRDGSDVQVSKGEKILALTRLMNKFY